MQALLQPGEPSTSKQTYSQEAFESQRLILTSKPSGGTVLENWAQGYTSAIEFFIYHGCTIMVIVKL